MPDLEVIWLPRSAAERGFTGGRLERHNKYDCPKQHRFVVPAL